MAHITGTDRAQVLLLPDTVDDYVGPDNPARFIDAFVDSLDLAGAGFERAEPKETGRPECCTAAGSPPSTPSARSSTGWDTAGF